MPLRLSAEGRTLHILHSLWLWAWIVQVLYKRQLCEE